jgi:hypothetical protein
LEKPAEPKRLEGRWGCHQIRTRGAIERQLLAGPVGGTGHYRAESASVRILMSL